MLIVFIFAVSPMPIDIIGLAAGNLRLPAWKFFLPCWPGKTIKYIVLAYVGYWGWKAFIKSESLRTSLLVAAITGLTVVVLLVLALVFENLLRRAINTSH